MLSNVYGRTKTGAKWNNSVSTEDASFLLLWHQLYQHSRRLSAIGVTTTFRIKSLAVKTPRTSYVILAKKSARAGATKVTEVEVKLAAPVSFARWAHVITSTRMWSQSSIAALEESKRLQGACRDAREGLGKCVARTATVNLDYNSTIAISGAHAVKGSLTLRRAVLWTRRHWVKTASLPGAAVFSYPSVL